MVIMEQYKKSGPPQERIIKPKADPTLEHLEQVVTEQGSQIQRLVKEVTRLKTKLDAHADTINQLKRG